MERFNEWLKRKKLIESSGSDEEGHWESGEWVPGPDTRPKFSQERSTFYPLPPGVFDQQPASKFFIKIDMSRNMAIDKTTQYKRLYVPFGKNQQFKTAKEALALAMQIVQKEHGKYSRCTVFRATKGGGQGVFHDEPDTRFSTGFEQ